MKNAKIGAIVGAGLLVAAVGHAQPKSGGPAGGGITKQAAPSPSVKVLVPKLGAAAPPNAQIAEPKEVPSVALPAAYRAELVAKLGTVKATIPPPPPPINTVPPRLPFTLDTKTWSVPNTASGFLIDPNWVSNSSAQFQNPNGYFQSSVPDGAWLIDCSVVNHSKTTPYTVEIQSTFQTSSKNTFAEDSITAMPLDAAMGAPVHVAFAVIFPSSNESHSNTIRLKRSDTWSWRSCKYEPQ
jgi:hypothetical protein